MRPLLAIALLAACASAPHAPGARRGGEPCGRHADCAPGLVCEEARGACAPDECDADDCDRSRVGEGRCETVSGVTYARTCTYDGVRCLEWVPVACEPAGTCRVGPDGASCEDAP